MQAPDTKPGSYYVTAMRDDGEYRPLYGPFVNDHASALAAVSVAREKACELDARADFYYFGTARLPVGFDRPGILNDRLPPILPVKLR